MAQGLPRRPARTRRLGIGLLVLGAAVGCANTDKAPSASLPSSLPPPRLPAATTTTPKTTSATGSTVAPIDNRQSNSMLPASDAASALNNIPSPGRGQTGMISAPVQPTQTGNFRSQPATTQASPANTNWNSTTGAPVIPPASSTPELPAPGGLKNPSPSDMPQPPGPPITTVSPPTPPAGTAPALPTGLPKP